MNFLSQGKILGMLEDSADWQRILGPAGDSKQASSTFPGAFGPPGLSLGLAQKSRGEERTAAVRAAAFAQTQGLSPLRFRPGRKSRGPEVPGIRS